MLGDAVCPTCGGPVWTQEEIDKAVREGVDRAARFASFPKYSDPEEAPPMTNATLTARNVELEAKIVEIEDAGEDPYQQAGLIDHLTARVAELETERDEARDAGADFVLDMLAAHLGNPEYYAAEGSETWNGDVDGTIMNLLRAAKVLDPETHVSAVARAAASEAREARLREALEKLHATATEVYRLSWTMAKPWRALVDALDAARAALDHPSPTKAESVGSLHEMVLTGVVPGIIAADRAEADRVLDGLDRKAAPAPKSLQQLQDEYLAAQQAFASRMLGSQSEGVSVVALDQKAGSDV